MDDTRSSYKDDIAEDKRLQDMPVQVYKMCK